ncbi:MAG: CBS domain-containing protein [Thermoanaerobaculales bacterium]|nr:CBS domain-containing protein [Thermoanaerobaculales bacterium]
MKIITTHLSADFDAFASAVCAQRLWPDHLILFPGSLEAAVRRFRAEMSIPINEVKLKEARRHKIEHAVVLDTPSPTRLGEVWDLIQRDGCPVTLIDHHDAGDEALPASESVCRAVGATCTLMVDLMSQRGLNPSPEEASLLLMGIYEDTGSLSYRDTTPEDLRAAAWLVDKGATLSWVRRWVVKGLEPEQLELLNDLVEGMEERRLGDIQVAVSTVEVDHYHEEAAYVVHRWVDTFQLPVGIALFVRPPYIQMILRSRVAGLDVGTVAKTFDGGGHATAASARISDRMVVEVREELWETLKRAIPPAATAGEAAGRQIFSVAVDVTVDATKERLNQLRVNALPIAEIEGDDLVGVVTRQLLDRAISLGLGHRPVSLVMTPGVPSVEADTPLEELRTLFLEGSHRFVIVTKKDRAIGLLTRMELFRRLFERLPAAGAALDHRMAAERPVTQTVTRLLREIAPPWVDALLAKARAVADAQAAPTYLVGGVVRDLLLQRQNEDVDLVVEGDGIRLARVLAEHLGARCHHHEPFMTAVLTLPDGHTVDVASARTEFYRTPAALPEVITSLIRQDLYRRDFTINALAIALEGDRFGQLIDFFGGRRDLKHQEIRVLHSLSFIDDPTRAIRAVRYARRLGFQIAPDTQHLIRTAVAEGVLDRLSGQRLHRELNFLLSEPHPTPALSLLAELGLLEAICPALKWNEQRRSFLLEVETQLGWYLVEKLGEAPPPIPLFLGGLAALSGEGGPALLASRLQMTGADGRNMERLVEDITALKQITTEDHSLSLRVREVEERAPEALLLAMAGLDLDRRRVLARAAEAATRISAPVSGQQLRDAGIPQGPHIGRAIQTVRAGVIDGRVNAADALEAAIEVAEESLKIWEER